MFVDDARMPSAEQLPESLQDLVFWNAVMVQEDPNFRRDMERLVQGINTHFDDPKLSPQFKSKTPLQADFQAEVKFKTKKETFGTTFSFEVVTITSVEKTQGLSPYINIFALYSDPKVHIRSHQGTTEYYREELGDDVTLDMVAIPKGSFEMGSPESEVAYNYSERPQHQVTIAPFCLGKYPVT